MNSNDIIVSISCITYNHAPYIRQCLEGFLMQKTNFKYEVLIHDDCSTDGTTEIIREYELKYPDIIKPIYEEVNQYQNGKPSGSIVWNFPRAKGKYIAMCEGDDYWIDSLKLQKQVDILSTRADIGLVYAKVRQKNEKKQINGALFGSSSNFESLLLNGNTVPTLSVCFKKSLLKGYTEEVLPYANNWKMDDYPMWLYFAHKSKLFFINEVVGVYRILSESASHSSNTSKLLAFNENYFEIKKFFYEKFCKNCKLNINIIYSRYITYILFLYVKTGDIILKNNLLLLSKEYKSRLGYKYWAVSLGVNGWIGFYLIRFYYKLRGLL